VPRGKKTIASEILKDLEDYRDEEGNFLVLYDFTRRATSTFYTNLKTIRNELQDGVRIQKSAMNCKRLLTAQAIKKLAEHYKANVLLFRIESLE